jgi:hypothetical protein
MPALYPGGGGFEVFLVVSAPRLYTNRHPELVSGSIQPPARWLRETRRRRGSLSKRVPVDPARWILKRVQDDDSRVG